MDDSAFARNTLRIIAEKGGHEVVGRAADGDSGLKMYKRLNPELVTLDFLMAGKNGVAVLEEIIEHDPSAKVIMISGSGDNTVPTKALKSGAKDFVEKSFMQRDLLKVIDHVMTA